MYMAGVSSEQDLKQARDILIPLGEYFQIQVIISLSRKDFFLVTGD
jgi:hypothetical protein